MQDTLSRHFQRQGFHAQHAGAGEDAIRLAQRRKFDVAVFDMSMPGMSRLEPLEIFRQTHPECEMIMLSGQGTIETAVQAIKLGASDFLIKPFPLKDLEGLIRKASERRPLKNENQHLKNLWARCTR